jgi:transposase-like protein
MNSGKRRSQRHYSLAFKLSVVDQVEKGELSYKEAQRRYGIQGRSTVLVWLRNTALGLDPMCLNSRAGEQVYERANPPAPPERRIKELEEQLALSIQKAQLSEAVVSVLKNDYCVSVVKKRSSKPSRKGKSKA